MAARARAAGHLRERDDPATRRDARGLVGQRGLGGYSPDFDLDTYFLHDIPADLRQQMLGHDVAQSPGPFGDKCLFDEWPGIPLHVIAGRDDRFFPVELQQRVARERLGVEPDVVPGGHLAALSRPAELAAALARYL
jgi:pimeloyl-ACP methyl ester carboxylesterase